MDFPESVFIIVYFFSLGGRGGDQFQLVILLCVGFRIATALALKSKLLKSTNSKSQKACKPNGIEGLGFRV